MFNSDNEIDCYQDLILKEYANLENNEFIFENTNSRLNQRQISDTCTQYGVIQKQLVDDGLVIEYPDDSYRTMHIDLIYRAINAKAARWSHKIPLEFKLVKPVEENMPSFSEHKLDVLNSILNLDDKLKHMLIESLDESGYKGLANHQLHYLKEILERKQKCYLLVSPTSSGKSLIFYIATLAVVLSNLNKKGTKSIILYPRKALASDQLAKFLRVIHALNKRLSKEGLPTVNLGLDDGDTPRSVDSEQSKKNEPFRGIKCIADSCNGNLRYKIMNSMCKVVCDKCNKNYEEIVATKGDIWSKSPSIVFSNLSALNRRLMTKSAQGIVGPNLQLITLDEAHVYREEVGGHVRWLLRRIIARFETVVPGDVKFIVSSATVYEPLVFMNKLLGFSDQIYYEEYKKIVSQSKEKKRKLTLHLILAPNPLRSAESLAEELSVLLGTWGFAKDKKSIVFVDSVPEIERLRYFVTEVIIKQRHAQNDHLDNTHQNSDSFSWRGIAGYRDTIDSQQLASIFDHHYADLNSEERSKVEESFKNRRSGTLFATSTMELGMDIGNIAAVIQYKVPVTAESYVQRIGRAGRSDAVGRIALGFLVLTNGPSQIRYVLEEEYVRLLEPQTDIPVAWENEEIRKQHVIYSILDFEAANNRNTYLDFMNEIKGKWTNLIDALNAILTMITNVRSDISAFHKYQEKIDPTKTSLNILEKILEQLEEKANVGIKNYNNTSGSTVLDSLKTLRKAEDEVLAIKRTLKQTVSTIQSLKDLINTQELKEYETSLKTLDDSLSDMFGDMEKIRSK